MKKEAEPTRAQKPIKREIRLLVYACGYPGIFLYVHPFPGHAVYTCLSVLLCVCVFAYMMSLYVWGGEQANDRELAKAQQQLGQLRQQVIFIT